MSAASVGVRAVLAATLLATVGLVAPSAQAGGVMVLPAEARSPGNEHLWVAQAVADVLPRDLAFLGVPVISNEDRWRAHERLEIPNVAVARATSIRMAEALGATRLILGSYTIDGANVAIALRLLDVERGSLSAPLTSSGLLVNLRGLLHGLAWDVALAGPDPPRRRRDELAPRDASASFEAFRTYCQALRPGESARRIKLLRAALKLAPRFDEAELVLGRIQIEARDYAAAAELLAKVAPESESARRARFLQGVALYELGRYRDAAQVYGRLCQEKPGAAVLNNHALALVRAGLLEPHPSRELRAATDLERGATDVVFNLGWTLLVEGDGEAAAFWLRGLVRDDAHDVHARVVLAWALRRAGRNDEADTEWKAVMALAPSYDALAAVDLGRRFERLQPSEVLLVSGPDARSDAEQAAAHTTRAERLIESGDAAGALAELSRAAVLDPYGARTHRLLARTYQKLGDNDKALAELRMSLWCREDASVRLELAQRLLELGRKSEARSEAETLLRSEPENAGARRVLESK